VGIVTFGSAGASLRAARALARLPARPRVLIASRRPVARAETDNELYEEEDPDCYKHIQVRCSLAPSPRRASFLAAAPLTRGAADGAARLQARH
jgi:hypothetical protein